MGYFTPDEANYAFGGSTKPINLSLSAKQRAKIPDFLKEIKQYGRTKKPMPMNRPIMKINRPPTISMIFKGKTDP